MCPQGLAGSDDQQHAEDRPRPGPARARWPRLHTRRRLDHPFEYEAAPYSHTELDGNNARLARPGGAHQADDRQNRGSFRARRGSRAKTPRWRPRRSVACRGGASWWRSAAVSKTGRSGIIAANPSIRGHRQPAAGLSAAPGQGSAVTARLVGGPAAAVGLAGGRLLTGLGLQPGRNPRKCAGNQDRRPSTVRPCGRPDRCRARFPWSARG